MLLKAIRRIFGAGEPETVSPVVKDEHPTTVAILDMEEFEDLRKRLRNSQVYGWSGQNGEERLKKMVGLP